MILKKFYKYFNSIIEKSDKIKLEEALSSKLYGRGRKAKFSPNRCGIYFVYNDDDQVIYVGLIGEGPCTSLYDRFKGHSSGSHSADPWFNEISYIKYLNLPNFSNYELQKIERICINYNKNAWNYNDKIIVKNDIKDFKRKLLNHPINKLINDKIKKKPDKMCKIKKFFKDLFSLKRFKAYLFSSIFAFLLFISGIISYLKIDDNNFIGNIFCSIGASVLASIIVGILIDFADKNKNEVSKLEAFQKTKFLIKYYTLNFIFKFIIGSFYKVDIVIDGNKPIYDLFMDAFQRYKAYKIGSKRYKDISELLYNSSIYYLRMLFEILTKTNYENTRFHHFESNEIDFMDIIQNIEQFLLEQNSNKSIEEISNILDLLMNLDFQSECFKKPIIYYSDLLPLFNIYVK